MHLYRAYGLRISSEIELPELSEEGTEEHDFDLVVKRGTIKFNKLTRTAIYRRGVRADFEDRGSEGLLLKWGGVAGFCAVNGNELIVDAYTDDANLLSLFTVSEALGLILFQKGYFLLHASSVRVGNHAWCFMGKPGAGKSTTAAAFIKAGCLLLSDDLTAIKFDASGNALVIPAYPQLKIWDNTVRGLSYNEQDLSPVSEGVNKFSYQPRDNFKHEPLPLGQVFFLHKAINQAKLKEVFTTDVPVGMLKNFPLPLPLLRGNALKQHFLDSFRCTGSARIWKKRRPEGFDNLYAWVTSSLSVNADAI
jgi:hypothetical protein